MKSPIKTALAVVTALAALAPAGGVSYAKVQPDDTSSSVRTGPAADYPVVIGEPYVIDGVTYTPIDTMNYDQVGYVTEDAPGASGITGAHRILPLPSYVEVTSLDSGRTILVRLERRGPMTGDGLVALSAPALAQLGVVAGAPIRMRRVNPPEDHRADLRAGNEAPLRMDTPAGLLEVLRRRLPEQGAAPLGDPRQAMVSGKEPTESIVTAIDPTSEAVMTSERTEPEDVEQAAVAAPMTPGAELAEEGEVAAEPAQPSSPPTAEGGYVVQLGAFAIRANADKLALEVDGSIATSGRFSLVRVGPFTSRGQAEQALAKLRARGYSDALIHSLD